MLILWLAAFVVFLAVEAATVSLCSIWFAGGALAAFGALLAGAGWKGQLAVFVAVSFLLFLLVRPLAGRLLGTKHTRTNVDRFVGEQAVIKERVDNVAGTGSALLAGETWLARAAKDGEIFEPGEVVHISAISGAKLLVSRENTGKNS